MPEINFYFLKEQVQTKSEERQRITKEKKASWDIMLCEDVETKGNQRSEENIVGLSQEKRKWRTYFTFSIVHECFLLCPVFCSSKKPIGSSPPPIHYLVVPSSTWRSRRILCFLNNTQRNVVNSRSNVLKIQIKVSKIKQRFFQEFFPVISWSSGREWSLIFQKNRLKLKNFISVVRTGYELSRISECLTKSFAFAVEQSSAIFQIVNHTSTQSHIRNSYG